MTKITIGARGSKLSLAYVEKVRKLLLKGNKELKEENINFKTIKTSGDINQNIKLSEIGGKNLFCKEIEEKLIAALSKNLPSSIIKVLPPPPFDLFQLSSDIVQDLVVSKLE